MRKDERSKLKAKNKKQRVHCTLKKQRRLESTKESENARKDKEKKLSAISNELILFTVLIVFDLIFLSVILIC